MDLKFEKLCPECRCIMRYTLKYHLTASIKNNLKCQSCSGTKHKLIAPFIKQCPKCGVNIIYKQKSHLIYSIKHNIICKPCGYKRRRKIIPIFSQSKISKGECEFLDFMKIPLQYRQVSINTKCVDAKIGNIIYEFLGDYWHGNLDIKLPDKIHPVYKISFREVNKNTFIRLNTLKSYGYDVKYIWEYDWKLFKRTNILTIHSL